MALEAKDDGELSPEEKKKAYDQGLEGKGGSAWGPKGQDKVTHRVSGGSLKKLTKPQTLDKKGSGEAAAQTGGETGGEAGAETGGEKKISQLFKKNGETDVDLIDKGGLVTTVNTDNEEEEKPTTVDELFEIEKSDSAEDPPLISFKTKPLIAN